MVLNNSKQVIHLLIGRPVKRGTPSPPFPPFPSFCYLLVEIITRTNSLPAGQARQAGQAGKAEGVGGDNVPIVIGCHCPMTSSFLPIHMDIISYSMIGLSAFGALPTTRLLGYTWVVPSHVIEDRR